MKYTLFALIMVLSQTANLNPSEILKKIDDNMYNFKNIYYIMGIKTQGKGESTRGMKIQVWQSGDLKRLIRFTAPPNAKGMAILVLSTDKMYVYLPEYHRVRRVASHARRQTFMGTDYSYDDLSIQKYGDQFDPVKIEEQGNLYYLILKKKKDAEVGYERIDLYIEKSSLRIKKIVYYEEFSGEPLKVETRSNWIEKGKYESPTRIEIVNNRTEHKTLIDFEDVKFDVKLPGHFFSKKTLTSERLR